MTPADFQRIESLHEAARALDAAARAEFLQRECGGDDELRREVASLLAARDEAAGFLSQPVLDAALLSGAKRAAQAARLGSAIGQYQLLSVLGVGGMGEVFLAEDTRLHRQVALKLLPPQFSQQPGRVRRFEQEARATTALNHPNIVTLYDTGQHDGSYFIVTELVDGQTLRERLTERGALPVNEALNIAGQIATALAAAHAAGIVHRDIKPENVMLRRDGFVKVLDFGLAKQLEMRNAEDGMRSEEAEVLPPSALHHPQSVTAAGALLGTLRYMSPEQARGAAVDARTDVFSLGIVLHEMLSGRAPFHRATATETLAAILEAAPIALPEQVPATLRQLVTRALRKEREQRWQTADEFAAALRGLAEEAQFSARLSTAAGWRFWLWRWPMWAGAVLLAVVAAYFWRWPRDSFESTIMPQLKFTLVDSWKKEPEQWGSVLSSSPDSNLVAFSRVNNGRPDIYIKEVGSDNAALNLTNDAWDDFAPVWSPDGRAVAYLSVRDDQYEIWLARYPDGNVRQLGVLAMRPTWLTSWTRDGTRIYYEAGGNLYAFWVTTGRSRQVTNFTSGYSDREFSVSADDQWLAYKETVANVVQIFVVPLGGGTPQQVTHEGEENGTPQWLPDGERLLYRSRRNGIQQICLAFRDGRTPLQITSGHEQMIPWDVTPDSRRVFYFAERDEEADIFLLDVHTGMERPFNSTLLQELFLAFAPDGQSLVFQQANQRRKLSQQTLFNQSLAAAKPVRLSESGLGAAWSPLGDQIVFLRQQGAAYQLWTVRPEGTDAHPLVKESVSFKGPAERPAGWTVWPFSFAPDGSQIAYAAIRKGQSNLFVIAAAGSDGQQLTDNRDAELQFFSPLWSRDGKQLAFLARRVGAEPAQYAVYLYDGVQARPLWQAAGQVRLLGWSAAPAALYVAAIKASRVVDPLTVTLLRLSTAAATSAGRPVEVMQFEHAYWQTFTLASTANQLAYVSRQDNADNLWLASLANGQRRRLTTNADPGVSLGSLAWSPQADLIGFTKQSNTTSIWMIENFK